jgi:hypothetical protein
MPREISRFGVLIKAKKPTNDNIAAAQLFIVQACMNEPLLYPNDII